MIIVSPQLTDNEVKFIPRDGLEFKAVLTDEVTGVEYTEYVDFTADGYYTVCSFNTEFIDDRKYRLVIYSSQTYTEYKNRVLEDNGTFEFNADAQEVADTVQDSEEKVIYTDIVFASTQEVDEYTLDNEEFDYSASPNFVIEDSEEPKRKFTII